MTGYFSIFVESVWKASIIPLGNDATFYAMKSFGTFDMTVPFLIAVAGATIGQMFNWAVGEFLLSQKSKFNVTDRWHQRVSTMFNKYGICLLLVSWAPLCNMLVVVSGFVNTKPRTVFILVLAGQIFNYGRYLL
jgi:membrane protein YqaA with SNARE-associated domain